MSEEYTPTTEQVRSQFAGDSPVPADYAEFDQWLNAERARIWEQCAQAGWESKLYGHRNRDELMARNPYEADA